MLSRIETYKILRTVAFVVALGLSYAEVQARVLSPNPVTTVEQLGTAITASQPGDTIFIQAGTFNVNVVGWDIPAFTLPAGVSLIGVGGQAHLHLTAQGGGRLFDVAGSANPNHITRIQNITMTSARTGVWTDGGAIRAISSGSNIVRLEIDNSNISAQAGNRGGAIFATGAYITIRHSDIHNSTAQNGGAFHLTNSTVHISDSRIFNNGCPDPPPNTENGGAFWVSGGRLTLERTNIFNNAVCGSGLGGAIFISGGATVILERCNITGNTAVGGGAGFYLSGSGNTLRISYSTIAGNAGTGGWASGGGAVAGGDGNSIHVDNSIISGNTNANDWEDGNEITGGADQNISNSVVDTAFVVNNDPTAPCLAPATVTAAGCVVIPDTIIIVINPDGSTESPPIELPGGGSVEVGSGGGQTKTLTLTITQDTVCPNDTIHIVVQQANIENLQLWRVDSLGNQIQQIGATFNTMREPFTIIPNPRIPIKHFRVFGTYNNAITYSSIESVVILPAATLGRIGHVRNVPPVPPLPPSQP